MESFEIYFVNSIGFYLRIFRFKKSYEIIRFFEAFTCIACKIWHALSETFFFQKKEFQDTQLAMPMSVPNET
jgi:hypothetical protein